MLRAANRAEGWAEVHSDAGSARVRHLLARSQAALCIWDAPRDIQIRIAAAVAVLTGPAAAAHWARVPMLSRAGYAADPPPATPIGAPTQYRRDADIGGYAVLRLRFTAIDLLSLGPPQSRALYRTADGWAGRWLSP